MRPLSVLYAMGLLSGCHAGQESLPEPRSCVDDRASDYVVASVLGRSVTREDLNWESIDALHAAVLVPILEQYRAERNIVATDAAVESCARLISGWQPIAVPDDVIRKIAADHVLTWNTSKALFEEYGGTVIFQQFNALEPVGAYLKLLRDHENRGTLYFNDARSAERFWKYFANPHMVVDPDKVDYSVPWWEKKASK